MSEQTEYAPTTQVKAVERNAIQEYEITPSKVKELVKGYMELRVLPADKGTYKAAHEGKMVLVKTRTSIDKRRKQLGEDARKWVGEVNDAAKQLLAPIEPAEAHLKAQLKTEDDRIDAIRQAKVAAEEKRVSDIREKIEEIKTLRYVDPQLPSKEILKQLKELALIVIDDSEYGEFTDEADGMQARSRLSLQVALDKQLEWEKEQVAVKAEAERLKIVAAEQEREKKKLEDERKEEQERFEEQKAKLAAKEAELKAGEEKLEAEKKEEKERKAEEEETALQKIEYAAEQKQKNLDDLVARTAGGQIQQMDTIKKGDLVVGAREIVENLRAQVNNNDPIKEDKGQLLELVDSIKAFPLPEVQTDEAQTIILWVRSQLESVSKGLDLEIDEL